MKGKLGIIQGSLCMFLSLHHRRVLDHNSERMSLSEEKQNMVMDIPQHTIDQHLICIQKQYQDSFTGIPIQESHRSILKNIDSHIFDYLDLQKVSQCQDILKHKFLLLGQHKNRQGIVVHIYQLCSKQIILVDML